MESFLSLFIFHDTSVVGFLVIGITIIVVFLLLFNQKTPDSIVKNEVGGTENIEGALRRVLGEGQWVGSSGDGDGSAEKVGELEKEVLEKDRTIAELNKQLTQSSGSQGGGGASGDDSDLKKQIAELEARLEEYELIEDDIADLSLYKVENEKLKTELERLKSLAGQSPDMEAPVEEIVAASSPEPAPEEPTETPENHIEEAIESMSADLVAEFEKIVDSQDAMEQNQAAPVAESSEGESDKAGQVLMADQISKPEGGVEVSEEVHPKLQNVNPDSKEEAEVFITELRSLKKGS